MMLAGQDYPDAPVIKIEPLGDNARMTEGYPEHIMGPAHLTMLTPARMPVDAAYDNDRARHGDKSAITANGQPRTQDMQLMTNGPFLVHTTSMPGMYKAPVHA